ncbi:uncharacterized protein ACIB01_007518 isoform 1-T2 [Guaruba guarouba]
MPLGIDQYWEVLWRRFPAFPVLPGPEHPCLSWSPCTSSKDISIAVVPSHPLHVMGLTPLPSDAAFQIAEAKLGFAQKPLVSTVQSREPECDHAAIAGSSSLL